MGKATKGAKKFNQLKKKGITKKTAAKKKLSHQIGRKEEIQKAKKNAKDFENRTKNTEEFKEDDLDKIESVDDLLKADIFAGSDEEENLLDGLGAEDDSDDEGVEDGGDTEGVAKEDTFASHEKELEALKKKDPEFFKFLMENDQELLEYRDSNAATQGSDDEVEEEGDPEEPEEEGEEKALQKAVKLPRSAQDGEKANLLSMDRWELISKHAFGESKSFPALRAAVGALRSVTQLLAGGANQKSEFGGKKESRKKKKAMQSHREYQERGVFNVEDDAVCEAVVSDVMAGIQVAMDHHLKSDSKAKIFDVTKAKKWAKVKALARIFWSSSLTLLRASTSLNSVLMACQSVGVQKYLWQQKKIRALVLKSVTSLWSLSSNHQVRELAFFYLRNACSIPTQIMEKSIDATKEVEDIILRVCKGFTEAARRGYGWHNLSTFRFMENCIVELMKLDDKTAYRIAYSCIRRMALVLRNSVRANSHGVGHIDKQKQKLNQKMDGKLASKKAKNDATVNTLYQWQFVRSIYLWSKVVTKIDCLRTQMTNPLVKIITMAMESRIASLNFFPYAYHCLKCLNTIQAESEQFVPVCDRLLQLLRRLIDQLDRVAKSKSVKDPTSGQALKKTVNLETMLKLSDTEKCSSAVLEGCARDLKFLFVDHLGVIARSPSFPELVHPVLLMMKKLTKNCRNTLIRKDVGAQLVSQIENTTTEVRKLRDAAPYSSLADEKLMTQFLIFPLKQIPIARYRVEILNQRATEERTRVEAERKADGKSTNKNRSVENYSDDDDDEEEEGGTEETKELSKRALKRQRQKEKKRQNLAEKADDQKRLSELKKRKIENKTEDVVEVADFSDDSDDEVDL